MLKLPVLVPVLAVLSLSLTLFPGIQANAALVPDAAPPLSLSENNAGGNWASGYTYATTLP